MIRDKTENPTIYGGSHEHETVLGGKRKRAKATVKKGGKRGQYPAWKLERMKAYG